MIWWLLLLKNATTSERLVGRRLTSTGDAAKMQKVVQPYPVLCHCLELRLLLLSMMMTLTQTAAVGVGVSMI